MEGGRSKGAQHSPALVSASGPGEGEVCIGWGFFVFFKLLYCDFENFFV